MREKPKTLHYFILLVSWWGVRERDTLDFNELQFTTFNCVCSERVNIISYIRANYIPAHTNVRFNTNNQNFPQTAMVINCAQIIHITTTFTCIYVYKYIKSVYYLPLYKMDIV